MSQTVKKHDFENASDEYLLGCLEDVSSDSAKARNVINVPVFGLHAWVFLASAAVVLLLELALSRIFVLVLWTHLAFMLVSTALFGLGLSGVFLALRPNILLSKKGANFFLLAFLVAISILASSAIVTNVPFRMWSFSGDPINFVFLAVWYLALVVPFFFAGLLIAELLK